MVEKNSDEVCLQFSISDTGIGIPEDKIERIFEPYQQGSKETARKYGGTGLGLTIIQKLIELQRGTISVDSTKGKGTEFKVVLPFIVNEGTTKSGANKKAVLKQTLKEKQISVLYADDVLSNQFLMQGYCQRWDIKLDTVSNGARAIEMASNTVYDLILLDLQMPIVDGFEAARKIRLNEKDLDWDTPIIAITGDYQTETKNRIQESGINDVIIKPIDPQLLFDKITENLQDTVFNIDEMHDQVSQEKNGNHSDQKIIDFLQIDVMYQDVPDKYNQLIELLVKEYHEYRDGIIESVLQGDFKTFQNICHSMTSNMKLFRMEKMQTLLNEIKSTFENSSLPDNAGDYPRMLGDCFDELLYQFELKQK